MFFLTSKHRCYFFFNICDFFGNLCLFSFHVRCRKDVEILFVIELFDLSCLVIKRGREFKQPITFSPFSCFPHFKSSMLLFFFCNICEFVGNLCLFSFYVKCHKDVEILFLVDLIDFFS